MKYLSVERFLKSTVNVQELIRFWWKPSVGDIVESKLQGEVWCLIDDIQVERCIKAREDNLVIPLLTEGQMIELIRGYAQMDIYTVDEEWCIQLFDKNIAANDGLDCNWEGTDKSLLEVLVEAIEYIAE